MKLNKSKIDLALARKSMTTTDLAKVYGVSRARMSTILNAKESTPVCVGRLSKALEVEPEEIIETEN